jgi:hypothetical protein
MSGGVQGRADPLVPGVPPDRAAAVPLRRPAGRARGLGAEGRV